MSVVFYNSDFIDASEVVINSSNRSFKYGDGLFETIFISHQKPAFIHLHIERLLAGMHMLEIDIPQQWNRNYFTGIISQLAEKNNFIHARCRLTVWRDGSGNYLPDKNSPSFLIELTEQNSPDYILNNPGINLGVYTKMYKSIHPLSALKTANALIYVLAAKYAHEQSFDDVVILNSQQRIADCINTNIFIFKNGTLFTPAANEGGIQGVMQSVVKHVCIKEGINITEGQLQKEDILQADEVFLTNAIAGLKWVKSFEHAVFKNTFSTDLIFILNEAKNNDTLVSP